MKVTYYNTNNAWGFGGLVGKLYDYENGLFMKRGKLCYRHLPPINQTSYHFSPTGLWEDSITITKKQFDEKTKIQKPIADGKEMH